MAFIENQLKNLIKIEETPKKTPEAKPFSSPEDNSPEILKTFDPNTYDSYIQNFVKTRRGKGARGAHSFKSFKPNPKGAGKEGPASLKEDHEEEQKDGNSDLSLALKGGRSELFRDLDADDCSDSNSGSENSLYFSDSGSE